MSRIKIPTFGGMVPALDDRLIPDTAATFAENTWLYAGHLRGLPAPKLIHTLTVPTTAKIFRIPTDLGSPGNMYDALFMEFDDANTDVIRSPVFDDTYQRYYWVSAGLTPKYNTLARMLYTADPPTNVVTFTDATDVVNWTGHPLEIGDPFQLVNSGGALPTPLAAATTYYVSAQSFGTDSFRLSTSYANAIQSVSVTLGSAGTGTTTLTGEPQDPWLLGIPTPSSIVVSPSGGAGAADTRSYVVTWVSEYGEEGAPSDPLTVTGKVDDTWAVTMPSVSADDLGVDRNLRKARIYRTVVGSSGVATFFQVAELDIWTTSYNDTLTDAVITNNSQLTSTAWTPPPTDLEGFTMMANGILAGFRDNEVWFTDPYRPHAWPAAYVLTVEHPIVGLGIANQALVACTRGNAVTFSGVNPAYMASAKLAALEPCISRGSILSAPEGVYYASSNGLVLAKAGSCENITRELITRDKWQLLTGNSALKSARFGTAYYAFGTVLPGAFEETAFDTESFTQEDFSNAFVGVLIDPFNQRVNFSLLRSDDPVAGVQIDVWTGEVLLIRDGGVYWVDQGDALVEIEPCTWTSKEFQSNYAENFSALKVYFEVPDVVPADFGTIKIYADGELIKTHNLVTSGKLMRLPSDFKANFWQFKIETSLKILSVQMATSVNELRDI